MGGRLMSLTTDAYEFAKAAHESVGQKRKYTDEPYIVHPAEVAGLVSQAGGTEAMIAAAYLHDVVEDTGVTNDEIRERFGAEVAELVAWLTDVSKPTDGNRAKRKEMDRQHTAAAPSEAKTVKLADLISNADSIIRHDPGFAKRWMSEKKALLDVLQDGDPRLYARARRIVDEYYDTAA